MNSHDLRTSRRRWLTLSGLLAGTVVASSGCARMLATALYMSRGNQVDPDFKGLEGKKVAVVVRPVAQLSYTTGRVESDLARALGNRLQQNVKKIKLVDPQRVDEWTDVHEWTDFAEIGRGVEAERVVGIDLQDFQLMPGQTLYQGRAKVSLKVLDITDGAKTVFQKHLPQVVYPPNASRPAAETQQEQFRREFVEELAETIGRTFYPYDAKLDYARDTAVLD